MSEYDQRLKAAVEAGDGQAVAALLAEASSKAERKAAKKAAYLLGQRGITVPEPEPAAAPGAALAAGPIPIMMAPPGHDAGRVFTLAFPEGRRLMLVEAAFEMPVGLLRLQASPSTRAEYLPWARQMCKRTGELPARVEVTAAIVPRKLREIRALMRAGRFGEGVDESLGWSMAQQATDAPHPAESMRPEGAPLAPSALPAWALRPFEHHEPMHLLRDQASERGRIWSGDESPTRRAAREWADEWGAEAIQETLWDAALAAHGLGEPRVRDTYLAAAERPIDFVVDVAEVLLARPPTTPFP